MPVKQIVVVLLKLVYAKGKQSLKAIKINQRFFMNQLNQYWT